MKLHLPLLKTLISALIILIVATIFETQLRNEKESIWMMIFIFLGGLLYTHFFEYVYHRFFLHKKTELLNWFYHKHAQHHYRLHGQNFTSRNPDNLKETLTSWYIFPILFFAHYFMFIFLFGSKYSLPFFCGVTLHFLCYQITHWCTHVKNNNLDTFLQKTFLKNIWNKQIIHHKAHHNKYFTKNFNFTYPFLGDIVFKTLLKTKK